AVAFPQLVAGRRIKADEIEDATDVQRARRAPHEVACRLQGKGSGGRAVGPPKLQAAERVALEVGRTKSRFVNDGAGEVANASHLDDRAEHANSRQRRI